ncbi:hypothetical protein [Dyella sp. 2HG41-7]|uniref:hypothetical protein n=1 Tax=Dyella sp. 2HG41-7 TaxID=2883239 RepID=UPI001F3BF7A7|nr:hypothetical protein [Dyella sp. 2HG41-7]
MKPDNVAFLRKLSQVMLDQKHFGDGVYLTGLNSKWRPAEMSVEDALEDSMALLNQAIGVFDKQEEFPLDQWGAMQQLYMVRALLVASYESLHHMALVERDCGAV